MRDDQLDLFAAATGPVAAPEAAPAPPRAPAKAQAAPRVPSTNPTVLHDTREAARLAERAAYAWNSHYGGTDIGIPLGVCAALSLAVPRQLDARRLAAAILSFGDDDLRDYMRHLWAYTWAKFPHLVEWARPLHDWLGRPAEKTRDGAVRATTAALLNGGILDLNADTDRRRDTDLLGVLLTELRSTSGRQGLGEFHTPPALARAIAECLLTDGEPTDIFEPTAGSGIMWCAAAARIRALGGNPADHRWIATEIDPLAAAVCAVNALVWELGADVVIAVADALADPDADAKARAERAEIIRHRDDVMTLAPIHIAFDRARRMVAAAVTR